MSTPAPNPWATINPGTIVDVDLVTLAHAGQLITAGFDETCVRQACYELRASEIFYDPALPEEQRRTVALPDVGFVLRPHRSVICIAREALQLPADVLGRVLTKGQLFSIGILPVNTYADPGFSGQLGITLVNSSERYVRIRPGDRIAKIEFSRLPRDVAQPYHGQHGYATGIWPIPVQFYADVDVLRQGGVIGDEQDEFVMMYGPRLGDLRARVERYSRLVWIQLAVVLVAFAVLYALYGQLPLVVSVILGVASNLLTMLLLPFADRLRRHR